MKDKSKFRDVVYGVEIALDGVRNAEAIVKSLTRNLTDAKNNLGKAQAVFNERRDAMFREFPEMAPYTKAPVVAPDNKGTNLPEPVASPQGPIVFRDAPDGPWDQRPDDHDHAGQTPHDWPAGSFGTPGMEERDARQ